MDTKMVQSTFGYTMSTVEEGTEAVVRLAISPEIEGVTGRYFDGMLEARANRQAYDPRDRNSIGVTNVVPAAINTPFFTKARTKLGARACS